MIKCKYLTEEYITDGYPTCACMHARTHTHTLYPLSLMMAERCVVLLPGAAQASITILSGGGSST